MVVHWYSLLFLILKINSGTSSVIHDDYRDLFTDKELHMLDRFADLDPEDNFPLALDAREEWPRCRNSMNVDMNQGACGSCLAVVISSTIADMRCVENQSDFVPSPSDIMVNAPGAHEGIPPCRRLLNAMNVSLFYENPGVVSGSLNARVKSGCVPYSLPMPDVLNECTNDSYPISYEQDKQKGRVPTFWLSPHYIKKFMANGPIFISINSTGLERWRPTDPPFRCQPRDDKELGHAMKILAYDFSDPDRDLWTLRGRTSWGGERFDFHDLVLHFRSCRTSWLGQPTAPSRHGYRIASLVSVVEDHWIEDSLHTCVTLRRIPRCANHNENKIIRFIWMACVSTDSDEGYRLKHSYSQGKKTIRRPRGKRVKHVQHSIMVGLWCQKGY